MVNRIYGEKLPSALRFINDFLKIYMWKILYALNHHLLKTYPLIEDCGRCRDCGRNVHDFTVPDWIWIKVWGSSSGILCYDCFCNILDEKYRRKHRMKFRFEWNLSMPSEYWEIHDMEK